MLLARDVENQSRNPLHGRIAVEQVNGFPELLERLDQVLRMVNAEAGKVAVTVVDRSRK